MVYKSLEEVKRQPSKTFSSLATRKVMSFRCDTAACSGRSASPGGRRATDFNAVTPPPRPARVGVDGFLFHFSFAPRLIQLHRSYVLFLIKAYASRRRRSSTLGGRVHTRWVLMIFQWGERVPSFS